MRQLAEIPLVLPVAPPGLLLCLGASLRAAGISSAETAGEFLAGAAASLQLGTRKLFALGGTGVAACLGASTIPPGTIGAACLAAAAAAAAATAVAIADLC